jgi:hypothetical protein
VEVISMEWFTGSENDPKPTGQAPDGWCHAVDLEVGITACGTAMRSLQLWPEVPWIRARMAGGDLCPTCVAQTENEHAPV